MLNHLFSDLTYLFVHYIIQHWQQKIFISFLTASVSSVFELSHLPSSFLSAHYTSAILAFLTYFFNLFGQVEKFEEQTGFEPGPPGFCYLQTTTHYKHFLMLAPLTELFLVDIQPIFLHIFLQSQSLLALFVVYILLQ